MCILPNHISLFIGVSSGTFVVTQSPDLSVEEGETVNIACCWTLHFEKVRVNWLKKSFNFKNHSQGSNCSHLTLSNVTREDSGTYICRVIVEVPVLTIKEGNGTVITVVDNTEVNTTRGR